MKPRARRFTCAVAVFVGAVLAVLVVTHWGTVRDHVEAPSSPTAAAIEEEESEFVRVRRRSWARLIAKVWLEDPHPTDFDEDALRRVLQVLETRC